MNVDLPFLERGDGTRVPLQAASRQGLSALLGDADARGFLVAHGLTVEVGASGVRAQAALLHDALVRAAGSLPSAPESVRRHPVLRAMTAEALIALATSVRDEGDGGADLVIPLASKAGPSLRALPRPPAPAEVLMAMRSVAPEDAPILLSTLEAMIDADGGRALPAATLKRTLIPLLAVEETCGLAARVLGRAGVTEAAPPMRAALARTASLDNRLALLGGLMRLGQRALALRTLRSILAHGGHEARRGAIGLLTEVAAAEDAVALHDMLLLTTGAERVSLAAVLYRLGDPRAYKVLATGLEQLGPESDAATAEGLLRAMARLRSRRFGPLLAAYARRETRPWFAARARSILAELEATGSDEPTPEALLERAEDAYFGGRPAEAAKLLQELITLDQGHARGLYLYANCLKDEQRLGEALAACDRALLSDATHWRAHRLRGSLLWDLGRHDEALDAYDRALTLHPVDPYTWYYKGYVLYRLRRDGEALPCLDRALSLKGDSPYIHNQKAFCLERLGRHAEAARCYRKSLQLKPDDPVIRDYLGQALQASGRLDEALAAYEAALRVAPERAETLYHRADVLYDLERWDEAAAAFSAYLALREDSYNAWFNRGLCLRFLGRYLDAAQCFRRALSLRPDSVNARRHLAWCLQR